MAETHAKSGSKQTGAESIDSVAAIISRIRRQRPDNDEEIRREVRRTMLLY